jgi:hypothetical protein
MFDNICEISPYLAYGMLTYILASVYYLLKTLNIGTPFNDSLTIEQIKIKKESASTRRIIFVEGIVLSLVFIIIYRPFLKC